MSKQRAVTFWLDASTMLRGKPLPDGSQEKRAAAWWLGGVGGAQDTSLINLCGAHHDRSVVHRSRSFVRIGPLPLFRGYPLPMKAKGRLS